MGTPPAMSLRDLMAEAEAEERREKELAKVVTPRRSSTERSASDHSHVYCSVRVYII